jgi:hypothetical protein
MDMTDAYKSVIIILSVMLILYAAAMYFCFYYLYRRKRGIKRYYKVKLTYPSEEGLKNAKKGDKKDSRDETETMHIMAYGVIDIMLLYRDIAKTDIKRLKPKEAEAIDDAFYDIDDLTEAWKKLYNPEPSKMKNELPEQKNTDCAGKKRNRKGKKK